jgi:pilus assembly protein Flp/PilA
LSEITSFLSAGPTPNKTEILKMNTLKSFWRDEEGATAIEYGLIAALISIAIIAGVKTIGTKLSAAFDGIQGNLS